MQNINLPDHEKESICFSVLMIILLISFSNLFSQDWPQFRGINRDSKVTGFKAPKAWPAELKQVWKINVGFGDATPVLSGKKNLPGSQTEYR